MSDISTLPVLVAIKLLDAYKAFFEAGDITMKAENAFATEPNAGGDVLLG